ncbi:MAG: CHAT domain-containing protein [Gemmatimonadales bacterium]
MHLRSPLLLAVLVLGCGGTRPPDMGEARAPPDSAPPAGLDSLMAAADSLHQEGEYEQARVAWVTGLQLVQAGLDVVSEARILTSLGLAEWRLGDYEGARAHADQARTLLESKALRTTLPRTYNALGLIAWDQGRLGAAAELWQKTIEVAREVGDQEYVAKPAMNLGLWYAGIGDLPRARESFAASLVSGRALAIRPLELRSLVNLAMVANQSGEPRLALAWLDSASAEGVEEDFLAEDNYRSQLALAAWGLGDPGVALAALDSAVRRARAAGLRQSEAANLTLMADIYWEAGDPGRALGLHAQAEAIHAELELPSEQGQNLQSAARIRAALEHGPQARELATRALALHQQAEDLPRQLDDRLLLAELGAPGQLDEARRIARTMPSRAVRTRLGLAEARIAAGAGRTGGSLRALAAISVDLDSGLSAEVAEAEALRARAWSTLGKWDSAIASGKRAVAALERIRSRHGSDLLRASFASFRAGTYGDLVAALLARGRTDEALEVSDAARGGWTLGAGATHLASAARADREALLLRIDALEEEIRSREADELETGELRARLRQAEREHELSVMSSASGASNEQRPPGRAGHMREALEPDVRMLAYLVTPSRLFVFDVTRESTRARVVPVGSAEVEARVRLARQLLGDPAVPPNEADAVLAVLGRWLLDTVPDRSRSPRRLVIVPHGALSYLPFAALRTIDGQYLVQRYVLVHLPTAAFAGSGAPTRSLVAGSEVHVTALAPLPRELPGTGLEVGAVRRVHRDTRVLLGRRAGEAELREALHAPAITHVASHGVLNRANPLFSRIELASGRVRASADDGRLEVHEVFGLDIRSPLVFLSGCETGLGPGGSRRHAPGEDVATLAAAFLAAGAGQVISTLWAIPDSGAATFAARFYGELGPLAPAEALARTQREMLAGRFHHPYYWAGYRLSGSGAFARRLAAL